MASLCKGCCKCWIKKDKNSDGLLEKESIQNLNPIEKSSPYECRFKFCCFWCTITTVIIVSTLFLIIFLSIIPNMAQNAADNTLTTALYTHLLNPTNHSITLDATIQLSNSGPLDATIHPITADVYFANTKFATLPLPKIHTKANYGAIFNLSMTEMDMTGNTPSETNQNIVTFKKVVAGLLQGIDQELHIKASPQIDVSIGGITVSTTINMDNILLMQGAAMENPTTSNFTVMETEANIIHGVANIHFSTSAQMYLTLNDVTIELYNITGSYVGYSFIKELTLKPGYNSYSNIPTYLVRDNTSKESIDTISEYVGNFMAGKDQKAVIVGPVSTNKHTETVIDGCINSTLDVIATQYGNLIVAGMMTSASQIGWYSCNPQKPTECKHMVGAYSTVMNPLNVPITLLHVVATVDLLEPVEWDYSINTKIPPIWILDGHCNKTQEYSLLTTGHGMFEHDWDKTEVYIKPYSSQSFFVQGLPQNGQFGENKACVPGAEPLPCCYLTETVAAICRDNPILYNESVTHDMFLSHAVELDQSFISCNLSTIEEVRIGEAFEVNVTYTQDWLPLFYGYEVYAGYKESYGLNCSGIKIYS